MKNFKEQCGSDDNHCTCEKIEDCGYIEMGKLWKEMEIHDQHIKLTALMNNLNLGYPDISDITGHTYESVKSMLQPNREVPRWVKLVLYVWDANTICHCSEEDKTGTIQLHCCNICGLPTIENF